ncbi:hypothetical protein [Deinococcus sp. PEB2-67]
MKRFLLSVGGTNSFVDAPTMTHLAESLKQSLSLPFSSTYPIASLLWNDTPVQLSPTISVEPRTAA